MRRSKSFLRPLPPFFSFLAFASAKEIHDSMMVLTFLFTGT